MTLAQASELTNKKGEWPMNMKTDYENESMLTDDQSNNEFKQGGG
jgi:hypothetical protein